MIQRGSVYIQYDSLIRKMCSDGLTLSEMCRMVGGHKEDLKYYIENNGILHPPFLKSRPLEKNSHWNGGRIIDEDGYILIKTPNHPFADRHNYVREHRLVMERVLGRYLLPNEVVHHKDGNKQNNNPENLELFQKNSDHLRSELAGRIPKWTPDGIRRIQEGIQKSRVRRQTSIPKK